MINVLIEQELVTQVRKSRNATTAGENTCVSCATKFCARSSSPTGNPGTFAPDGESGSVVGPPL